jgi:hypothetical protein
VTQSSLSAFAHHANPDGSMFSFCQRCLMVVAQNKEWEADLEAAERGHVCDPERLEYLRGPVAQKRIA